MEGYGTSETSAVLREDGSKLEGVLVKLEDVPSLGYFAKDNVGQLCVKSDTLFAGYMDDPERTKVFKKIVLLLRGETINVYVFRFRWHSRTMAIIVQAT